MWLKIMLSPETAHFRKKIANTKSDLQFLYPYRNSDQKRNDSLSNLYFEKNSWFQLRNKGYNKTKEKQVKNKRK